MNGYDAKHQLNEYQTCLINEEKSTLTVEKYLRDVRAFLSFLGKEKITKDVVCAYKEVLQEAKYAASSINSMLASLNSWLAFIGKQDCRVKSLRIQKKVYEEEDKELTKEEYHRLLEAAKEQPQLDMIIQTIARTGIRVSELSYFTVEAVRKGIISVQCKNKIRTIFISKELRKKLIVFAKQHGIEAGYIFITKNGRPVDRSDIWKRMKKLCEAADVSPKKVFPHNLRKLFARMFYEIEKDVAKLADVLGHSRIETTRIYIMGTGKEHRRVIEKVALLL